MKERSQCSEDCIGQLIILLQTYLDNYRIKILNGLLEEKQKKIKVLIFRNYEILSVNFLS